MTCNYCGWCEEAGVAHDCQQELRRNIASLTAQRDELLAAIRLMLEAESGAGCYESRYAAVAEMERLLANAEVNDG